VVVIYNVMWYNILLMSHGFLPEDRAQHQTTECFALYTDVAKQMFAEVYPTQLTPINDAYKVYGHFDRSTSTDYPAEASLYIMSRHLIQLLPRRDSDANEFDKRYGVTEHDIDHANKFDTFQAGFGDPDFPWHFAPAVAAAVAHEFEAVGALTPEQHREMTLTDWANIIGSGWFSDLIHSLAYTSNGVYGAFGNEVSNFRPGALLEFINGRVPAIDKLFDVEVATEEATGEQYLIAKATKALKVGLRSLIRDKSNSVGCPVARLGSRLPEVLVDRDQHVLKLIKLGELSIGEDADPTDDEIRVTQEETAIDDSLTVFADLIDRYERQFGQPKVVVDDGEARVGHDYSAMARTALPLFAGTAKNIAELLK
jgi:hypothetical protein